MPGLPDAYLLHPDGTIEVVIPKNGTDFKVDEIQAFVQGHFQSVPLSRYRWMSVNEEGKLHGLPLNPTATVLMREQSGADPSDYVAGVALVCPEYMIL